MKNNYVDVWNRMHKEFTKQKIVKYDDWLDEYEEIIKRNKTQIIELGCGVTGNNTIYLLEKGKKVLSCDFAIEALKVVKRIEGTKTLLFDMLEPFPLQDNCTDLVIADLCLHYFREEDTKEIIKEIQRLLKCNGYLFIRVNSTHSKEYQSILDNNLEPIEYHLFFRKEIEKRFFDADDIKYYFKNFEIIDMKEENMNRWAPDKIIWKCVFRKDK